MVNKDYHIVHFDICTAFFPKCFLMADGGSGGGGESFRKAGNESNFDYRFAGDRSHWLSFFFIYLVSILLSIVVSCLAVPACVQLRSLFNYL